jgi:protease-4
MKNFDAPPFFRYAYPISKHSYPLTILQGTTMFFFTTAKHLFLIMLMILVAPTLFRAIKRQYSTIIEAKAQVAIVPIRGTIQDSRPYIQQLNDYFGDSSIKAILLTIDCSGATAGTAEAICLEIESLKRHHPKPVIGLIENVCTSGGYWIACSADYLIAPGAALVGGISGSFDQASSAKEDTQQSKSLQEDTYQQFAHAVARSRKLSIAKMDQWADGKLFTGQQAFKLHLIDALGSTSYAVEMIKQKALIEGDIEWVQRADYQSWLAPLAELQQLFCK